jgi:2-polyprenyl-3-methyl-5-hydroxy-6-metoxy-1,4-benzoquinol methylase
MDGMFNPASATGGKNLDNNKISVDTFNRLAEKYQQKYMDYDFYTDTYDVLCELLEDDDAAILDIACGPGNIAHYLLNKRPGFRIDGIDLAPRMIELATINNPTASFEVMDSRDIASIGKTYDAVISGFCTPYLDREAVARLIADVRGLLKEGGVFYLSTMEDAYEKSGFQSSDNGDSVYIHYYPIDYLERCLVANGFRIVETRRKAFRPEKGPPATDLFIFARAI